MSKPSPAPMPGFIEVEIGSYCNRQCAWCPNGWHDRGSASKARSISAHAWSSLLADLGAAGYRGWFAFHNYNEPMADPSLLHKLRDARSAMPRAKLEVHTNGDFLTRAAAHELADAGCALTRVTLYPSNARALEPPDDERVHRFVARLGLARGARVAKASKVEHRTHVGSMELIIRLPNLAHYTDRAGSAPFAPIRSTDLRVAPCFLPFHSAAIDVHGALKLCCHVYDSTRPELQSVIVGNVGETPFTTLWRSPRMESLRRAVASAKFAQLAPCVRCNHNTPRWMVARAQARARALGVEPASAPHSTTA